MVIGPEINLRGGFEKGRVSSLLDKR